MPSREALESLPLEILCKKNKYPPILNSLHKVSIRLSQLTNSLNRYLLMIYYVLGTMWAGVNKLTQTI